MSKDKNLNFSVVDFSIEHQSEILELFKKTFHQEISKEFWDWRFTKNPFGVPIIKLAIYNKKIIGCYLVHPLPILFDKKEIPVVFSMTTMTDPKFSGCGVSTTLANAVYEKCKLLGYHAVIGFANKKSHEMFEKKLGFKKLQKMDEIIISDIPPTDLLILKLYDFLEIPGDFFLNQISTSKKFTVKRDSDYLNWRFAKNPENNYSCYKIIKNEQFCGYFVLKKYTENKYHIVDFLLQDNLECYKAMLYFSKTFSNKQNFSTLTLWSNDKNIFKILDPKSVRTLPQETYFIVKNLNEQESEIENYQNWNIMMSDSDVF